MSLIGVIRWRDAPDIRRINGWKPLIRADRISDVINQHAGAIRIYHEPLKIPSTSSLFVNGPESVNARLLNIELKRRVGGSAPPGLVKATQSRCGKYIQRIQPGKGRKVVVTIHHHRVQPRACELERRV